ncbi:phosphotransferase-like protein [Streptomyces scabiei]|uniref:phosphotransferase-like protein n=1 Tax=Streptomyces scabiei TaxID=1930 RepID=UPI00099E7062|nr:hypothetical protein [Streptomyces scabiei]
MIDQGARDRAPGPAARQITQVHAHGLHDFECDTGTASPADCAQQIKNFLPHRSTPSAFEKLKANLPASEARSMSQGCCSGPWPGCVEMERRSVGAGKWTR